MEIRKAQNNLLNKSLSSIECTKETQFGKFLGSGRDGSGCLVPQILIDFHDFLEENNGFEQEGLFRLAGNANKVDNILKEIADISKYRIGGPDSQPWEIHEVATLIKKWFLTMPERLFSKVSDVQLRMCAENTPERIYSLLSEKNSQLFRWLINLLARVSPQKTKMDPFNLGLLLTFYDV